MKRWHRWMMAPRMTISWPAPQMRRRTAALSPVKESLSCQQRVRWEADAVRFMIWVPGSWGHLGKNLFSFLLTLCISASYRTPNIPEYILISCVVNLVWVNVNYIVIYNITLYFLSLCFCTFLSETERTEEEQDSAHRHRNYELWECVREC